MFGLQRYCYCISLYCGCIIISFYTIFIGLINAATVADEVSFSKTYSTNEFLKWFNVFHTSLMIIAAIVLLITILTTITSTLLIWCGLFMIHMITYYIIFNIVATNPFLTNTLNTILYILVILLSLLFDIYSLLIVYSYYQELKNPPPIPCVDESS